MSIWQLAAMRKRGWWEPIQAMYLNSMIRSLVLSLIGIFTPLFIYKVGLANYHKMSLAIMLVAFYYLLMRVVTLVTAIPISRIIEKIGFRHSILVSLFLLAANLILLISSEQGLVYISAAAIMAGLNIAFYWIARNSAISQDGDRKKIGTQMGWMTTFEQVATMLGPLAAGFVVQVWGYQTLFAFALAILFTSIIPLWSMPPHVHKNGASIKGFWYFVTNQRYTHLAIGMGSRAVDEYTMAVIWPLTIFLLGIKTAVLGSLFTAVAVASLFVRLGVGRLFDLLRARNDWSDEIVYGVSAIINAFLWMARLFVRTVTGILWIDIPGAIFGTSYSMIYLDYQQLGGIRMGNIAFWVYNEILYSIMTIWLMGLVMVGAWYGVWKEVAFLSAAFWLIVSVVVARESNMK